MTEACLHGLETLSWLPQDVLDIPGMWHLLRFVGIIVLFKVMEAGFLTLTRQQKCECAVLEMTMMEYVQVIEFAVDISVRIYSRVARIYAYGEQ